MGEMCPAYSGESDNDTEYDIGYRARLQNYLHPDEINKLQFNLKIPEFSPGEVDLMLHSKGSESSFNDDGVPPSEEEFFSSDWEEKETEDYVPPITRRKKVLIHKILHNTPHPTDSTFISREKALARDDAIFDFRNYILKRRAINAYKRLSKLKKSEIEDPQKAAFLLEKLELRDKKLMRPFYYENIEPACYARLLKKRKKAIRRKYELYATDCEYRDDLRNRTLACVERIVEAGDVSFERASELILTASLIKEAMDEDKSESVQEASFRRGSIRKESTRRESTHGESMREESIRGESTRRESMRSDSMRAETVCEESACEEKAERSDVESIDETDPDASSFYDDGVADSERSFFSSDWQEDDDVAHPGPVSRTVDKYHRLLNKYREKITDDGITINRKFVKSAEIEAQFKNYLERKRATKALARMNTINKMNLCDPKEEAERLAHMEIVDKKLHKSYYYAPNEPKCFKVLLGKRRRAILRKYGRYMTDSKFRHDYKTLVYRDFMRIQPAPMFEQDASEEEESGSESSFNDSEIPTSEEEFMSVSEISLPNYFNKPVTRTKAALYEKLEPFDVDIFDPPNVVNNKRNARLETILIYKNQLLDRRRLKAAARIDKLTKMGEMNIGTKALRLLKMEMIDKKLNRPYYYTPDEDARFTKLLNIRRRAIIKKCQRYYKDQEFRENLEARYKHAARKMKEKTVEPEYDKEVSWPSQIEDMGDPLFEVSKGGGSMLLNDYKKERRRERAVAGLWPPHRESASPIMMGGKGFKNVSLKYPGGVKWQQQYMLDCLLNRTMNMFSTIKSSE